MNNKQNGKHMTSSESISQTEQVHTFHVVRRYTEMAHVAETTESRCVPMHEATAFAKQEIAAYENALRSKDEQQRSRALSLGLAGIAEERWTMDGANHFRDLITSQCGARNAPPVNRPLTDDDRSTVVNFLRSAATRFTETAGEFRFSEPRLAKEFEAQAHVALQLASDFEQSLSIWLLNDWDNMQSIAEIMANYVRDQGTDTPRARP